jgi:hypothetical protein
MQQSSSWEASSLSASQEILGLLWYPKVYYRILKNPPPEPDESSPHLPTLFPTIHSSIISRLGLGLPSGIFPCFHTKNLHELLNSPMRATCHAHHVINLITLMTWWGVLVMKLLIIQYSPLCLLRPLRFRYFPQPPLFKLLSLRSQLKVRNQVSHPYETTEE